jgi:recombinational DNA repair ATPase RecF
VVSHLDDNRKSQLFDEINNIDLQCFFSVASQNLIPNNYRQNFEVLDLSI